MNDNELLLEDRITKIKSVLEQYGEDNFYIAFSGGKDSTILSNLIDRARPGNQIPRVFSNTGIEYNSIVSFVRSLAQNDERIKIIEPTVPIKPMLEKEGYPLKSKVHSAFLDRYQRLGWSKSTRQYLGLLEDKEPWSSLKSCPKCLEYQFSEDFHIRVSDKCCQRMKKDILHRYQREHGKVYGIIGVRQAEGGNRINAQCMAFRNKRLSAFQPLAVCSDEWMNWYQETFNVQLCELYYPPYNLERTGCKGCPFNRNLQKELDVIEKFFPLERKQCEIIWKPVYEEYRRIGYRLRKEVNE